MHLLEDEIPRKPQNESATTENFSAVRREGKRQARRSIRFYNLDAAIFVGYRVNSRKGVHAKRTPDRR
ncbi:MAG: hypothetical protein EPN14_06220, partial [Gallionella sp.]